MKKQAFTLIEVMVVLSILSIIAILAYNFFGGTMKEATLKQQVTKLYNDLRVLDDASNEYYRKNGSFPSVEADIVTAGIIKALPTPPSGAGTTAYLHNNSYAKYPDHNDAGDTSTSDGAWSTNNGGISDELCAAFNEYVGLAKAVHDDSASETYPAIYSCVTWDAVANSGNEIIAFFELD